MTDRAFHIDRVSVTLEGKAIVRDVSFTLAAGASMAVIGPNGAGKSTLLKCLLRLTPHDAGNIQLFDTPLERYSRRVLAQLLGYVPQASGGMFPYTVEAFVLMARYPYLNPFSHFTEMDRSIARAAMEQADVAVFADRLMHTLSGGERQKVFIAAALTQQPRIMLLDEATAFLDYRHQVEVLTLVEKLRRDAGLTVITVTHDLNQGVMRCDHVLAMKDGRVAFWGPPKDLLRENQLEAIYETPFNMMSHPETGATYVFPRENQP